MDRPGRIIKHEFDIVHESKQQARKFVMEVVPVLLNEFRTGQIGHNGLKRLFGLRQSFLISIRQNAMALTGCLVDTQFGLDGQGWSDLIIGLSAV